tara:strand:- start:1545 stop:2072 length:528 start_codon:yes stop_codon:yes gene_type:complete
MDIYRIIKTLPYALPLAVSGCAATRPIPPAGMPGSEIAGGLADTASRVGLVWPIAMGAAVAILAGIASWFLGSRAAGVALMFLGALLATSNAWALEVLDYLVVPSAWLVGACGLMGVAYLGGILWHRWSTRRRLLARGEYIATEVAEKDLTPGAVKKVLSHITDRKFNPKKRVSE